jgi:hypothetical protein
MEVINLIQTTPSLKSLVKYHNVTKQGVPNKNVTRVPTIITQDNKLLVGGEVKQWLISMTPCTFSEYDGSGIGTSNLDYSEGDLGLFSLDSYGASLKPNITPELQARIDASVTDLYASMPKAK